MNRAGWHSFRELDAAAGRDKGAAFRVFKALRPHYREGVDYVVLEHAADAAAIAALRQAGRIYASSVNVVLAGPALAAAIAGALRAAAAR
ncbi:hypothetical protein [Solimonas soli]|uniref:hypothetical protein n=1 Tax=Solimonas soli TaxID=413479 RepID=UPI0004AD11B6|nr:hypothetical protein [Solimonas soli]